MWGKDFIEDQFGDPEDYPGPGTGSVTFEVQAGDSISQMGRNLEEAGVVASVDAFTDAASSDPDATGIQVGFYPLKKEMKAVRRPRHPDRPQPDHHHPDHDPRGAPGRRHRRAAGQEHRLRQGPVREGARRTRASSACPTTPAATPRATCSRRPTASARNETPASMLQAMVDRWKQAADDADLEGAAERLGYTPQELMTVASLVEAEGRGDDMPKIARVIYNRLENPGTNGTIGRLQLDATVNYAHGREHRGSDHLGEDRHDRLALQHLPGTPGCRPARSRHRVTRPSQAAAQPGRRRLVLLRHGQPQDRRDEVRGDATRSTLRTSRSSTSTARPPRRC